MASQLIFDFPADTAMGQDDFFVGDANRSAFKMLQTPDQWPLGKLLIVGPQGAGKTHLGQIWAAQNAAQVCEAAHLVAMTLPSAPILIENVHRLPERAQETLFHINNHCRAQNLPLLMTSRTPPGGLGFALADLQTRMDETAHVFINPPDEATIGAIMVKLFADLQSTPDASAIAYLQRHLPREYAVLSPLAAAINQRSLMENRPITRPMVVEALASLSREFPGMDLPPA